MKLGIDVLGQQLEYDKTGIQEKLTHTQIEFTFKTFSRYTDNKSLLEVVLNILFIAFALFLGHCLAFKLPFMVLIICFRFVHNNAIKCHSQQKVKHLSVVNLEGIKGLF